MLPLRNDQPTSTRPFITFTLIAINILVFSWEFILTAGFNNRSAVGELFFSLGAIPILVVDAIQNLRVEGLLTVLTSMFLHGGPAHIFGNMLFLFVFGNNIEDKFGHIRFLLLYLLFGATGAVTHSYIAVISEGITFCQSQLFGIAATCTPAVGASGAISGILGAFLILFPRSNVINVFFVLYIIRLVRLPAFLYLGFWFLIQFFFGALGTGSSVAYWAHVGGFVAGALVALPTKLFWRRNWQ
ncbi:rhomboid family intramembrane serine protease [Candidatus Bathyarchaeota archaeon]|nr:rhomboid family intramembrane serine protease [Candidatus Bathyarchaeota archaeon]|tara:strand:- start:3101 stop:3829 length:729 start_codon:yes stop_codon:yes gene_type:complete